MGFDPLQLLKFLQNFPKFLISFIRFSSQNQFQRLKIAAVLTDFKQEGGIASGHYFWQDLICAKWIFEAQPVNHFDIGSRVDGFVSHLLAFREVDILDIRPIRSNVPGLKVHLGDAQLPLNQFEGQFQSVSSLHAIEHFGLGRYGDKIDYAGHKKGLINIAACVQIDGYLYLSFPIGSPSTEFNSQRILDPNWPIEVLSNFELIDFVLIPWKFDPVFNTWPSTVDINLKGQAGLYKFKRKY